MTPDDIKGWIVNEIHTQLSPMADAVADVKRQNNIQTIILDRQVERLSDIDVWRRALWGNGIGPPGYLEIARAEDKAKYDKLLEAVNDLKAGELREEGKEELKREIEVNRIDIAELTESRKTHRLARIHFWIAILASFAGAWTLTLLRPILKALVSYLLRVIQ